MVGIGDAIQFVDSKGRTHNALITTVHGLPDEKCAVNLVYVTDDTTQTDPYGNQIIRESSVVHKVNQSAHGNFWTE